MLENKQQASNLNEFRNRANAIIDENTNIIRQKENTIQEMKEELRSCRQQVSKRSNDLQTACEAYDSLEQRSRNSLEDLKEAHLYISELRAQISNLENQLKKQEEAECPSPNGAAEGNKGPMPFFPRCASTPLAIPQNIVDQQVSQELRKEGEKILKKYRQRNFSDPSLSWDDGDMKMGEHTYENTKEQETVSEGEAVGEREKSLRIQEIDNLIQRQTKNLQGYDYNLRDRNKIKLPNRYKL